MRTITAATAVLLLIAATALGEPLPKPQGSGEPQSSDVTPFIVAFKICYEKAADRLSKSEEPAETVVVATFAACAKEEEDMRRYLLKQVKNVPSVDKLMQATRTRAREQLVLRIINRRLNSP
jgi:hypothetical protein